MRDKHYKTAYTYNALLISEERYMSELALKLPGPAAGVGGSLTVAIA